MAILLFVQLLRALHFAVHSGNFDLVKYLVEEKGMRQHINTRRNDTRWTSLHEATSKGYLEITEFILSKGAAINAFDKDNNTPLHKAASKGYLDVVKLLVNKGANLNPRDINGLTPLHCTTKAGHLNVVKFLVERGADINIRDNYQDIPMDLAIHHNRTNIIDFFNTTT